MAAESGYSLLNIFNTPTAYLVEDQGASFLLRRRSGRGLAKLVVACGCEVPEHLVVVDAALRTPFPDFDYLTLGIVDNKLRLIEPPKDRPWLGSRPCCLATTRRRSRCGNDAVGMAYDENGTLRGFCAVHAPR